MNNILKSLLLVFAFGLAASLTARADHPSYLHALSDLRLARAYVAYGDAGPQGGYVIQEIDRAIGEIKAAAIDDGKNLDDHLPIDANIDFHGRFHRALDLLNHAHGDVNEDEDNGYAQGLKHRALEHIDRARHTLRDIIAGW
ncbi:MAG: hypothetical protein LV481_02125 [Methylacidiphilales bacterium]|nr:hypothetical protein [Candidatus Methylacidiphilales bacterium]